MVKFIGKWFIGNEIEKSEDPYGNGSFSDLCKLAQTSQVFLVSMYEQLIGDYFHWEWQPLLRCLY